MWMEKIDIIYPIKYVSVPVGNNNNNLILFFMKNIQQQRHGWSLWEGLHRDDKDDTYLS